jgi:hypothetical protein
LPRKYPLIKTCKWCGQRFETKELKQETCSRSCGISLLRDREIKKEEVKIGWACGGGVQSTAIAVLIYQEKLPKPDYAWFVDCGWEKQSTLDYVNNILKPKLTEVSIELKTIKTSDYFDSNLFDEAGRVVIPLYVLRDGGVAKCSTHCSGKWKIRVANKYLREQGVKRCVTWIGISFDERRRVKESNTKWNQIEYPLVGLGIRREDCLDLVAREGWPKPEHTACLMCPNQHDYQWHILKTKYPQDWERAVEAERQIQEINPNMFLHKSCKPLESIDFVGGRINF